MAAWPASSNRRGNPYNHLLTEAMRRTGAVVEEHSLRRLLRRRYDVVHLHWPEWVFDAPRSPGPRIWRSALLLVALWWARRRGATLVWTVHNLGGHEGGGGRVSDLAWRGFTRQVDGVISLTEAGVGAIRERFPALAGVPAAVVPHGHYRDAYPLDRSRAEARSELGLPAELPVALFFGRIRPYKNVPALIEAFRRTDAPGVLLVVGRPHDDETALEVRRAAGGDPRVRLHLELVADDEVPTYLRAADLVVLPYREVLNSGAALLALSFDRPVLAPARGAFVDLQAALGRRWVRADEGVLTGAVIEEALAEAAAGPRGEAPLDELGWDRIARLTLDAYAAARDARRVGRRHARRVPRPRR